MNLKRSCLFLLSLCTCVLFLTSFMFGQETTAGLQGTVKDATGAVVPGASVTIASPSLVGGKIAETDGKGFYHFSNLPPGPYSITVTLKGFTTLKRDGLVLEVGHLPSVDITLTAGAENTVVEVSAESPAIDVTTNTTLTNITQDVVQNVPHGVSYQSVIQFAPSARNEPLMGSNRASNGSGGVSPGNGSNGGAFGYSVAGGSDSENSYLVEGQETANLIGGYSHTNVPFDFIQEVQIKSSGVEAEHGGSLGGVVNVIMKKGTPSYHGSVFFQFENQATDGSPTSEARYNPLDSGTSLANGVFIDPAYQNYQPIKPKTSYLSPGFTFGGPLLPMFSRMKDRMFFFVGFNPQWQDEERKINYGTTSDGGTGAGVTPFSRNSQTYYTTARIDAKVTDRIRVYGSWLYQYQREAGQNLPFSDSTAGLYNVSTGCFGAATSATNSCQGGIPAFAYGHGLGYSAPNMTVNTGADIMLTHNVVSTSRFGYYFENYHDWGFPTNGVLNQWMTNAIGGTDAYGNPLPASLQQSNGYYNAPLNANTTAFNANKAIQFDENVAFFKSGWAGTHNFKFGYQLNRLSNTLNQHYNEPLVQVYAGYDPSGLTTYYTPASQVGINNCAAVSATTGIPLAGQNGQDCQGQYGYVSVYDFGSAGSATSYNHSFFAQDSWTLGHGVTVNAGVRIEKEYLPGEATGNGVPAHPISFGWGDKIAPRLGAAWDVFQDGKVKVFGSYGVFNDIMKLNLAISSFGGQYWQQCYYALNTPDISSIIPEFNSSHRYCTGQDPNASANFSGGTVPTGLTFLESQNFRSFPTSCSTCSATEEGVAPGLKPYRQHEAVGGVDYQLSRNYAFEARYDRRRLDHAIEDSSIFDVNTASETFVIVNPGQGVNSTFSGFCSFLYGAGNSACASSNGAFPPNQTIPAARSYDGVEFRLNKAVSNHWGGLFSYTYSHFRGNYTGLTSSDLADGGLGGRNSPNNSRSFDEPYFSYNSMGGSSSGLLPTDRPNAFKGYAYYEAGWLKKFTTDLGIFQVAYSGSPNTSYMDVGLGGSAWPVDIYNRGVWADVSQNPSTGAITLGTPRTYRNPWYTQTDFNFNQSYKISEVKALSFQATFSNIFNQHVVTAVNEQIDTGYGYQFAMPGGQYVENGVPFYAAATHPYSISDVLNSSNSQGGPLTINSQYGKPMYFQAARTIRLGAKFVF
jgi:hypothetical protein